MTFTVNSVLRKDSVEAEGYCVNCRDYLCQKCFKVHRETRPTQYHVLLGKSDMPKDAPVSGDKVSKDISSMCTQHVGKPVEFYCQSHDYIGCSKCIITGHRLCDKVESIEDESSTLLQSKEYGVFKEQLQHLKEKLNETINRSRDKIAEAEICMKIATETIKNFRREINELLDKHEEKLRLEAESLKAEDVEKLNKIISEMECMQKQITSVSAELQSLDECRKVCQIFIFMKESNKVVARAQATLHEADKTTCRNYSFTPCAQLRHALLLDTGIGKINVTQEQGKKDFVSETAEIIDVFVKEHQEDIFNLYNADAIDPNGYLENDTGIYCFDNNDAIIDDDDDDYKIKINRKDHKK